ncbi:transmembrane amino acid transporter protein-domain-containing protein [Schizophyllum commune]
MGTPNMRALREQYGGTPPLPNVPPRTGSISASPANRPINLLPPSDSQGGSRRGSQVVGGISRSFGDRSTGSGTSTPSGHVPEIEDLPVEEKAKVLRRHLVSREERLRGADSEAPSGSATPTLKKQSHSSLRSSGQDTSSDHHQEESDAFPISYETPGADITHSIYKWHHKAARPRERAISFTGPSTSNTVDPSFEHIHEPGGFRRNFLKLKASEQGVDHPTFVNNFIDFLFIFGHFAGEDLEEEEEVKSEDEDVEQQFTVPVDGHVPSTGFDADENTPLVRKPRGATRSASRRRRTATRTGPHGNATVTQAVMMLLKAFIGTGILFLGRGFYNGGLLFSAGLFVAIAMVSLYTFLLLVHTKYEVSGSFGDIGGKLYGNWMRYLILASIVISQLGFVSAYIIFVAQNLQAFVMGVTKCATHLPMVATIGIQVLVFLPLVLIRDLAKLSTTALVADAFILFGLIYIFGTEISIVAERGVAQVQAFNYNSFSLFVGTAVFSFEGIGLVIPITDAMKEPRKFPKAITGVMFFLTVLFGGAGALGYLTFGSEIQTNVLVNFDTSSKIVQTVQFLYAMAILLSVPLQIFPATRILENGLFVRSGKQNNFVKWQKNFLRFFVVFFCALISWLGANDLDKFVAFIGCFACVPLCYVYPAMLHYKAAAFTRKQKIADIAMMVFGIIACVFTTAQTLKLMFTPEPEGAPIYKC